MKHLVILSTVAILLFLSFPTAACQRTHIHRQSSGYTPQLSNSKPRFYELTWLSELAWRRFSSIVAATKLTRMYVFKFVYKGRLTSTCLCVRIEIYWHWIWDETETPNLPRVGDEMILPIEVILARAGSSPPDGQDLYYIVPFYYSVERDGIY